MAKQGLVGDIVDIILLDACHDLGECPQILQRDVLVGLLVLGPDGVAAGREQAEHHTSGDKVERAGKSHRYLYVVSCV